MVRGGNGSYYIDHCSYIDHVQYSTACGYFCVFSFLVHYQRVLRKTGSYFDVLIRRHFYTEFQGSSVVNLILKFLEACFWDILLVWSVVADV